MRRIMSRLFTVALLLGFISAMMTPAYGATTIEIGDYIQFGTYLDQPILWRVINLDEEGDPLLYSEHILSIKAFDAAGDYYTNSERKYLGSNEWESSSIRQWLNSSDERISWTNNPPSSNNVMAFPYDEEGGFLSEGNFTTEERNAIKPVENKVLLSGVDKDKSHGGSQLYNVGELIEQYDESYEDAYYRNVSDRVFLLSVKEMKEWIYDRGFQHLKSPTLKLIQLAGDQNYPRYGHADEKDTWDYWLRTPHPQYSCSLWHITDGVFFSNIEIHYQDAAYTLGVAPALYLHREAISLASGTGTKNDPFVTTEETPVDEISLILDEVLEEKGISTYTFLSQDHLVPNVKDIESAYLKGWDQINSPIVYFANEDGTTSICVDGGSDYVYIYEFDREFHVKKQLRILKELPLFGSFTKDTNGDYYILYGQVLEEHQREEVALSLVKYDAFGTPINTLNIYGNDRDAHGGIKIPFSSGNCKLTVENGVVVAYMSRTMFKGGDGLSHQASFGFMANAEDVQRILGTSQSFTPYVSHSFDQFVLHDNGEFIFVDQGDAYPRGFSMAKRSKAGGRLVDDYVFFPFKLGPIYQYTFAQMGGIEATGSHYLFMGSSEKTEYIDRSGYKENSIHADSSAHNESRNVFLQLINKSLNQYSQPIWITNYNEREEENAAHPRLVKMKDGEFALLWEKHLGEVISWGSRDSYITTYIAIIDGLGNVKKQGELPGIRLGIGGEVRYNAMDETLEWAVNHRNSGISLYRLDPNLLTGDYEVPISDAIGDENDYELWQPSAPTEIVATNGGWQIRLNKAIDSTTLEANVFVGKKGSKIKHGIHVSINEVDPAAIEIFPSKEYDADTNYVLYIDRGLMSKNGKHLTQPLRFEFKTE